MRAALLLSVVLVPAMALAVGPQWTWEAGKQSSNGSITIKSTSGSTTYTGTQNPTGAVAKTNQNAVTQPPTVIIQATGGGSVEAIPIVSDSGTSPSCPAGYTKIFSVASGASAAPCPSSVFNIAGSRFSLVSYTNGYPLFGFFLDSPLAPLGAALPVNGAGFPTPWCGSAWPASTWSATLCTK